MEINIGRGSYWYNIPYLLEHNVDITRSILEVSLNNFTRYVHDILWTLDGDELKNAKADTFFNGYRMYKQFISRCFEEPPMAVYKRYWNNMAYVKSRWV